MTTELLRPVTGPKALDLCPYKRYMKRPCDYCGKRYEFKRRREPGYCSINCRVAAHRKRNEGGTGMTQKDVTVSLVRITQDTHDGGIMVREETYFRLPGADYNKICEALLDAKFELVDTVQEAIDAKLAEGRNE